MEQKKARRKPNFFDILFIILILAVAVAAYLVSHDSISQTDTVTRTYVLELQDLQEGMEDCVSVGDRVTDNVKNYDMGTVTALEVQPCTDTVLDEEGRVFRQTPAEDMVTLLVTVQAETVEDEDSVDTVSGYTLRTGTSVSCSVGSLTAAGYILSVER